LYLERSHSQPRPQEKAEKGRQKRREQQARARSCCWLQQSGGTELLLPAAERRPW
jgi:hypothetical protein